jgi:hypothetical protein
MGIQHVHKAYVILVIQYTLRKCSLCVSLCQSHNVTYILPDTELRVYSGCRLICVCVQPQS